MQYPALNLRIICKQIKSKRFGTLSNLLNHLIKSMISDNRKDRTEDLLLHCFRLKCCVWQNDRNNCPVISDSHFFSEEILAFIQCIKDPNILRTSSSIIDLFLIQKSAEPLEMLFIDDLRVIFYTATLIGRVKFTDPVAEFGKQLILSALVHKHVIRSHTSLTCIDIFI